jgi:hypothetical protein
MKERPILFSAPMVRALLDGSKTQTRRTIKPQPQPNGGKGLHPVTPYNTRTGDWNWVLAATGHGCGDPFQCPYGQPGDRLWVKETIALHGFGRTLAPQPQVNPSGVRIWSYVADEIMEGRHGRKQPSIFMRRWESRIDLEITSVRVERLQDISEADCYAEGIRIPADEKGTPFVRITGTAPPARYLQKLDAVTIADLARAEYASLWESINGIGSWKANPWVWCVEFARLESPREL